MTKKHHPSNRRERLWIKEIKDAKKGRKQLSAAVDYVDTGRLRRKDETEGTTDALGELEVSRAEETSEIKEERPEPLEGNSGL